MERTELPTKERLQELAEQGVRASSPLASRAMATAAICALSAVLVDQVVDSVAIVKGWDPTTPFPGESMVDGLGWILISAAIGVMAAAIVSGFIVSRGVPRWAAVAPSMGRVALRWPSGSLLREIFTLIGAVMAVSLAFFMGSGEVLKLMVRPLEQWRVGAHNLLMQGTVAIAVVSVALAILGGVAAAALFRWQHRMSRAEVLRSEE